MYIYPYGYKAVIEKAENDGMASSFMNWKVINYKYKVSDKEIHVKGMNNDVKNVA